ncbi:MAG TPA: OmpA family protein [Candidatus Acidoferrales bacterium]|nr:OmpA family protein [Candidatus Acidoferrales bacterium]
MTNIPEVEERIHENALADGPSNPVAQHVYDGFPKRQSRSGASLVLGAAAIGLVLVLASVFGLWLVRSVRRLNREVVHLNRQTEQLNQRVQVAEQHVKSLDQRASQAAAAQAATIRPDQVPDQVKQPETTSAAQAQSPLEPEAAAQPPTQAAHKTEENRTQHADELQKLKQSLGQIAETRRTADGVVMTLGEKSLRFDSGKSAIAPQYRAILNRVAGVLTPLKGYSIYVYGYTDDSGTKEHNLELSASRARAVRAALVKAGVDPSLISTKGFGKSKLLVRDSNAKARAANRRVEIGIVSATQPSIKQAASKVPTKR